MSRQAMSNARLAAVQALYQMELAGSSVADVMAEMTARGGGPGGEAEESLAAADAGHFEALVRGVAAHQDSIDQRLRQALGEGWKLDRIDSILRAILRAGVEEMEHCPTVPARVVLAEYVDIGDAFFDSGGTAMVNGILDRICREVRPGSLVAGDTGGDNERDAAG